MGTTPSTVSNLHNPPVFTERLRRIKALIPTMAVMAVTVMAPATHQTPLASVNTTPATRNAVS